ncbi:hypothetical protein [Halpernia sp.]|uniref:hypothetical protein n=1 Tax=Halpernia sp. TaxID=2782209 RepID=UPI003A8D2CB2
MKKYILLLAVAAFVTSCQKIQPGGNKDVLKKTDDIVRYNDENAPKPTYVATPDSIKNAKPVLVEPVVEVKKEAVAEPKVSE